MFSLLRIRSRAALTFVGGVACFSLSACGTSTADDANGATNGAVGGQDAALTGDAADDAASDTGPVKVVAGFPLLSCACTTTEPLNPVTG